MSHRKVVSMLFFMSFIFVGSCSGPKTADLVLRNGRIATVDEEFSIREAVAVGGERIIFVGGNDEVESYVSTKTEVIELDGKLVLPGLIDAHAHIHSLGEKLTDLDISNAESYQRVVEIVAERVKSVNTGEWIIGGRWDHTRWRENKFPVHDGLSRVSPDNPVYLHRVDGNSALVNEKALEIAGITKDTPEPFGGSIIRKKNGEPTGVLINRPMNLVNKYFPEESEEG